ncbi:hypothetical protein UFOVP181_10 [uncultured Caudovirales phage]|uniref:Uncharacterized protein n=1 Tax=uncultured Caudovirales phage TaxID=2100421 RepID=A0A6J5KSS7_9CAUD|nr:hypothetical protein UFOVP57_153 [uncultured Caudovirales phage]CAB5208393.1 hypothetical protein UFOVP181_10 [uncultured Caudovirales phage]
MNKRLQELMREAGYAAPELAGRANRLAELLVKECARDFDKTYMAGGETMGNYIRRKFGVEE